MSAGCVGFAILSVTIILSLLWAALPAKRDKHIERLPETTMRAIRKARAKQLAITATSFTEYLRNLSRDGLGNTSYGTIDFYLVTRDYDLKDPSSRDPSTALPAPLVDVVSAPLGDVSAPPDPHV